MEMVTLETELAIRIQSHTVIIIIGTNVPVRTTCATQLYERVRTQTPYVKQICTEPEIDWLNDSDRASERASTHPGVATISMGKLLAALTSTYSPLVIVMDGFFTTCELSRISDICCDENYYVHLVITDSRYGISGEPVNATLTWQQSILINSIERWQGIKTYWLSSDSIRVLLNLSEWNRCQLPPLNWWIVGDIHGCFSEFIELLGKIGWGIVDGLIQMGDGDGLILAGDIVDRGDKVPELLGFLHRNMQAGREVRIVAGNHEIANMTCLQNPQHDADAKHFSSVSLLRSNPELAKIFQELMARSTPFVQFRSGSRLPSFVVTHSPCDRKYRCRLDPRSVHEQSYITELVLKSGCFENNPGEDFTITRLRAGGYIDESMDRVKIFGEPRHYTGHLTVQEVYYHPGVPLVLLDTGCAYGGKLSAINHSNGTIVQVASQQSARVYQVQQQAHGREIQLAHQTGPHVAIESAPCSTLDSVTTLEGTSDRSAPAQTAQATQVHPIEKYAKVLYKPFSESHVVPCPPHAGDIESVSEMLRKLNEHGVDELFIHSIPHGKIMLIEVTHGIKIPTWWNTSMLAMYTSLLSIMEQYRIFDMQIVVVQEEAVEFPMYAAGIKHIERLMESGAEGSLSFTKCGVSLGKALDMYNKAQAFINKNNSGKKARVHDRVHFIDIQSANFQDGTTWSIGDIKSGWSTASARALLLQRRKKSGTLSNVILKNTIKTSPDIVTKLEEIVYESKEYAMIVRSNTTNKPYFRVHTVKGLLHKYGPLHMCSSAYDQAVAKWQGYI